MKTFSAMLMLLSAAAFTAKADSAAKNAAQIIERKTGGTLIVAHSKTKKVFYINAQKRASRELIDSARRKMETALKTPIDMEDGSFSFPSPQIRGELSLYIIDDEKMPISLLSPEGRWAFVNVAPLALGRGEKTQFFEARVRKEMARIACMLFGGTSSTYKKNLLYFVGSAEELDDFERDTIPMDGLQRCAHYLIDLGVMPYRKVSYRRACQEGWAPAPTNNFQKTIWEEVHATPTKPIKIEFDPKTDTK